MIPAADAWGPFAPNIDQAETDSAALEPASVALNRLAPTDRRRILSSFARLAAST